MSINIIRKQGRWPTHWIIFIILESPDAEFLSIYPSSEQAWFIFKEGWDETFIDSDIPRTLDYKFLACLEAIKDMNPLKD